jgi:Cu/Ag efflux protein CusF
MRIDADHPNRALPARRLLLAALLCALTHTGQAATASATPASSSAAVSGPAAQPVYTRAVVRSIVRQEGGRRYVQLKLVPRAKLPFTTITYRVLDRRLLDGVSEGASVQFIAARIGGENTVTALRIATPCERFRQCE